MTHVSLTEQKIFRSSSIYCTEDNKFVITLIRYVDFNLNIIVVSGVDKELAFYY